MARTIFPLLSLLLTAGACLLIFLVLLAGAVDGFPVNQVYFIEVETSGIPGAKPISRWTPWNICGNSNGYNSNCGKIDAAFPFDPQSNWASQKNVPKAFIGTNSFYYMSRVVFAFMLISLFLSVCSLVLGFFALCMRIASYVSSVVAMAAWASQTVAAAVMTACYVTAQHDFQANNQSASLGREAFAFNWAALVCLMISTVFYCVGGAAPHRERGGGHFGRKKSTRSRGSFNIHDAETSSFVRA